MGRKRGVTLAKIGRGNNIVQPSIYASKNRNGETEYATTSNHTNYFKQARLDRISIFKKNKLTQLAG